MLYNSPVKFEDQNLAGKIPTGGVFPSPNFWRQFHSLHKFIDMKTLHILLICSLLCLATGDLLLISSSRRVCLYFPKNDIRLTRTTALQCADKECPKTNGCCADAVHGPVCFEKRFYHCAPDQFLRQSTSLCSRGDGACGSICFDPKRHR